MSNDLHSNQSQPGFQPQHDIALSTSLNGNVISILGNGNATIPLNHPATHFRFTLTDTSPGNVRFASLDTADGLSTCPPSGSGNRSSQVVGVTTNNHGSAKSAQFTSNNSNPASKGPLQVSYQWNFTCDAPYTVEPFDPIITNTGKG